METVRFLARQKKSRQRLTEDVAGGRPANHRRALVHSYREAVGQDGVQLDYHAALSSGNGTNTHRKRTVARPENRVNTFAGQMQQSVSMAEGNGLGPYIKMLREARGMTQDELGDRLGVSRQRVTQLEGGRKQWPQADIFNSLARALETPVQEFLRRAGIVIPLTAHDELEWAVGQMTEDGVEQIAEIARALLPRHRRRPGTPE